MLKWIDDLDIERWIIDHLDTCIDYEVELGDPSRKLFSCPME